MTSVSRKDHGDGECLKTLASLILMGKEKALELVKADPERYFDCLIGSQRALFLLYRKFTVDKDGGLILTRGSASSPGEAAVDTAVFDGCCELAPALDVPLVAGGPFNGAFIQMLMQALAARLPDLLDLLIDNLLSQATPDIVIKPPAASIDTLRDPIDVTSEAIDASPEDLE